jgi:hypothetical protein
MKVAELICKLVIFSLNSLIKVCDEQECRYRITQRVRINPKFFPSQNLKLDFTAGLLTSKLFPFTFPSLKEQWLS